MKRFLLTLLLALAVGTGAAWAEGYTVEFKKGANETGQTPGKAQPLTFLIASGYDYFSSWSSAGTYSANATNGICVGASKTTSTGSYTFTCSEAGKVEATKLIFTTHKTGSNTGTLKVKINGSYADLDTEVLGTQTVKLSTPTILESITVEAGSGYRIAISKIEVVTSAEGGEGGEEGGETPDPTPGPTPEGSAKFTMVKNINDIDDNGTYIIASYNKSSNEIFLMGAQKGDLRDTVKVETSLYTYPMPDEFVFTEAKTAKVAYLSLINQNITGTYPTFWIISQKDSDNTTNYISSTTVKKTSLSTTGCNFTLSFKESDYTATLKASVGYLSYNPSSPRFTTYASIQNPIYIYKLEADNEPQPLEKVTLEGADENGNISVEQDATLKFSAPNAAMYEITGDIEANDFVKNGKFEYVVTFPEGKDVLNITVTPYDEDLETLDGTASTFTITKIAAPDCGELTFTPASGTAITAGSTITLSADNAVIYRYGINTETENEFSEGASFTVSENDFIDGKCIVRAYPMNSDGKRGETAMAEYTLKEADHYALVKNLAHITPNATYILVGCKTDLSNCALMGKQNGTKYYEAIQLNKSLEEIISITPDDNSFNDLSKFNILKNEKNYNILLSNGKYLVHNSSDISSSETVTSNADFAITFDAITGEIVISEPNNSSNKLQYNSQSPRFKTYTSNQSPVYLYRLIDKEYDNEVPEELYIHGHFYDRYYDLDNPDKMDMTGDKVFSRTDFYIGGNVDHTEEPLTFVFTTHKPAESVARSHETSDWARITEGNVYHQDGKTAAADVNDGSEITPFSVEKPDYYTITADFSGYAPVVTATAQGGLTTGVEDVEASDANAPVEYYNLQGVRIAKPASGIVIRRQGKSVTKVFVK